MEAFADASALPRTLIVSESPFCVGNGFGVTLRTFFNGWPRERLWLFHTRANNTATRELCDGVDFADVPGHWGRRYALECLLARRASWRGWYSRRWLFRTLRGWRPDAIYTLVYSAETLAFAAWCARQLDCPLVAHIADDGLETLRAGVVQKSGALLSAAARLITISEEMQREYVSRYGLESDVLHNGAAEALFEPPRQSRSDDAFVVRYLGSVLPAQQHNAIEDVAAAVRLLASRGMNVRFELCGGTWTREHIASLLDNQIVTYRGEVSQPDGFELLKQADLLVVPVSFDPAVFDHLRLSLPTKLSEYLASGTPVLVYGPPGMAPVEFCRRHSVGSVVEERSIERLTRFILAIAEDPRCARQRAQHNREFVRSRYAAGIVRDRLRRIVSEAATRTS